jgi:tetratricopeptide (TPR) repeat protein
MASGGTKSSRGDLSPKRDGYNPSQVEIELAELYLRLGRLSDTAHTLDEADSEARKASAHEDLGMVLVLRAALARFDGRLDSAREMGEKAVSELRVTKGVGPLPLALAAVSSTLTARGDIKDAEKRLAETAAPDYPEGQGTIELARAELLLAKGQFQLAAAEAQRSAADFASAHLNEKSAMALVTEAHALEMLGRDSDSRACQDAQQKAAGIPNPLPILLARLAAWSLTGDSDSNVPADLHAKVTSLRNPELALQEDFDRAMRAKRTGKPDARHMFQALADRAANQGYLTMSRRARSLEQ